MKETGINPKVIRAGESNLFLSKVFRDVLSSLTSTVITLYNTDGSTGAARGAGIGCGLLQVREGSLWRPEDDGYK